MGAIIRKTPKWVHLFILAAILVAATGAWAVNRYQISRGQVQAGEFFEIKDQRVTNLSKTVCVKLPVVASTAEQSTGVTIPADAVVTNAYINVVTAEATGTTKTIKLGTLSSETSGNATGFINGISVSSTGRKVPSLVSGAVTLGALLTETVTDSGSATHSARVPYPTNIAHNLSYTLPSSNWSEFVGYGCVEYSQPFIP